jgi:glycosyltransferase involved in cell wall biosynthesis
MKFSIITYILHKENKGDYYSYEPYIREMNIWLKVAKEIIVVAPKISALPNAIEIAYQHNSISFKKIPAISFLNVSEATRSLIRLPGICFNILRAMKEADHIHVRCPGNIGLIACFIQIFFPKKPKTVKYAGNWDFNSKQPWSYRLQKWILSNSFLSRNIMVLVYGEWPEKSKNTVPFFTASFSETEKIHVNKDFTSPFKFIFVGSLSPGKRPLFAIQLIENLIGKGIPVKLEIYGSGALNNELQDYITTRNLEPFVSLMGSIRLEELKEVYKDSHFLILASQSEGWPKAVAEAMFFGCVPIATGVSCVPWMLGAGSRGVLLTVGEEKAQRRENRSSGRVVDEKEWIEVSADKIIELIEDPEEMKRMSIAGQTWSQEYTLERFEKGIIKILYDSYKEVKNGERVD